MDEAKYSQKTENGKIWDIRERAFAFAVRIVRFCRDLESSGQVSRTLVVQLLKAGTSVGANLEEAQGGQQNRISSRRIRYR